MSRETDLLFGLLALRMDFISKANLLDVAAFWTNNPKADLGRMLLDRNLITPAQHAALMAMVVEHLKIHGGDAQRTLVAMPVDRAIRDGLLALMPTSEVELSLRTMGPRESEAQTAVAAPPSGDRYRLGAEIARGGLGKVVEAFDAGLERDVAVKLVLDGMPPELAERFEREAKLTGRLDHPNIVPIYDFGTLGAGKRLFMSMKRIRGRDLEKLLMAIAWGNEEEAKRYSRPRLLRIFQDICLGMAFAHDRGVIHRDLKPANIMIGDYGETLIVDWGLAKELQSRAGDVRRVADLPAPGPPSRTLQTVPGLTLDGEIMGTPAFMAPEQAAGQVDRVDHRSDIYSLGAILYAILTFNPPFAGKTADEIISKVQLGRIFPPSLLAKRAQEATEQGARKVPFQLATGETIPPELDSICLKALAFAREDRYQSANELHDDIQLFLEGVKERERAAKVAQERVEKGRTLLWKYRALAVEIESQGKVVRELFGIIQEHQAAEKKRPLWDAEARFRQLEDDRIEAFAAAWAEFGQALAAQPDSIEALGAKCELLMDRYLDAEKRRDRKEMLLARRTLQEFDRGGEYRATIDAPGKLSIRTFAFECGCLAPVRNPEWRVEIAETCSVPWRDGRARPDLPLEDTDFPVPVVQTWPAGVEWGHTSKCPRREIRGAEVWIARYEERDRRLQLGPPKYLGKTPLFEVELSQGSWRCTLKAEGFSETLLPVRADRGATWAQEVNLYSPDEIPPGFCYVPGGPFIFGGEHAGGDAEAQKFTEDLFVARAPVTVREYIEFLNHLCTSGRGEEASRRAPREIDIRFLREEGNRFQPMPESEKNALLTSGDLPVMGISWFDAAAVISWRSTREGRPYRMMHEEEWEKSARGVDARVFPWGDEFDGSFSNTNISHPETQRMRLPQSFPVDESPYGIPDLGGNIETWCANASEKPFRKWCMTRGGSWGHSITRSRTGYRRGVEGTFARRDCGVRPVISPRIWDPFGI